ncbi:MAG: hypothetical protein BGO32_07050 [Bacteroidetes bacterium 37-13]|nr:MAG: hypothetical protein BGO32_07050 [Bacteroidetes bacterium 37-13]
MLAAALIIKHVGRNNYIMSEQKQNPLIIIPNTEWVTFEFEGLGTFVCPPKALFDAWCEFTKNFVKI